MQRSTAERVERQKAMIFKERRKLSPPLKPIYALVALILTFVTKLHKATERQINESVNNTAQNMCYDIDSPSVANCRISLCITNATISIKIGKSWQFFSNLTYS